MIWFILSILMLGLLSYPFLFEIKSIGMKILSIVFNCVIIYFVFLVCFSDVTMHLLESVVFFCMFSTPSIYGIYNQIRHFDLGIYKSFVGHQFNNKNTFNEVSSSIKIGTVARVEKLGKNYKAYDKDDKLLTSKIDIKIRRRAFKNGKALIFKASDERPLFGWDEIPMVEYYDKVENFKPKKKITKGDKEKTATTPRKKKEKGPQKSVDKWVLEFASNDEIIEYIHSLRFNTYKHLKPLIPNLTRWNYKRDFMEDGKPKPILFNKLSYLLGKKLAVVYPNLRELVINGDMDEETVGEISLKLFQIHFANVPYEEVLDLNKLESIARQRDNEERGFDMTVKEPKTDSTATQNVDFDPTEEIRKYAKLKEEGLITKEDYIKKKNELLDL